MYLLIQQQKYDSLSFPAGGAFWLFTLCCCCCCCCHYLGYSQILKHKYWNKYNHKYWTKYKHKYWNQCKIYRSKYFLKSNTKTYNLDTGTNIFSMKYNYNKMVAKTQVNSKHSSELSETILFNIRFLSQFSRSVLVIFFLFWPNPLFQQWWGSRL